MNESFLCNICGEDIGDLSKKNILKCNPQHIFCYDCIYDWYFKNKGNNTSSGGNEYKYSTCPICQKDGGFLTLPEGKIGIENIHFPKKIQQTKSYKPCDCFDKAYNGNYYNCNSSGSNILSLSNPNKVINLCYTHKHYYEKGNSIMIKENNNYETIESIYGKKQCIVTLKSGAQCTGNSNPQKNGNYLTIEKDETKYCVCKKHVDDFNLNKVLTIQNKSIIKEYGQEDIFNLCGTLLASGHLCKKKSNPKYDGKCVIHKAKNNTKVSEENIKVSYSKIKEDYETLYEKLNSSLTFLKNNVDKTVLENKIKYLETILGNIKNSIQYIGTTETSSKVEDGTMIIKYNLEENVDELKKGIDDFDTLVNKVFKKEDDDFLLPSNPFQGAKKVENKDVFEELNQEIKENNYKCKKELKIDLYNTEFKIDPHCNVKQKNGKLCYNPANIYYNLKCYKHHQEHYLKEKLTNNDELFVINPKQNVKKIKNKE